MTERLKTLLLLLLVGAGITACGGGGGGDGTAPPPQPQLALFAGHLGGPGSADGASTVARFYRPSGIAMDSAGNLYVADSFNNTIRRITSAGGATTLAGSAGLVGNADGLGAAARFADPIGITMDSPGNVYVADTFNQTIRQITPAGLVRTLAGKAGTAGSADGLGAEARFSNPAGMATDSLGNFYVADTSNHTIRRISPAGLVLTLAGKAGTAGSADGIGIEARFNRPGGVAADSAGNVYVADAGNHTIRKITAAGVVSTLAGGTASPGSADGPGTAARFNVPTGVAVDGVGNVYVADSNNNTIRRITAAGLVSSLAGKAGSSGSNDGNGAEARFFGPWSVATDRLGNVYVADSVNDTVRRITPAGVVTTLAGTADVHGSADGLGAAARFWSPRGIASDTIGNTYVADYFNSTIRKISREGTVATLAGAAGSFGYADGSGMQARFDLPSGVAADRAGNVYVADSRNNRIRRINPAGVVSTLAGTGALGGADGDGTTATFGLCYRPSATSEALACASTGIATDDAGNVYVADTYNHTIRKITPAGIVSTLAGTAKSAGSADGIGAEARFNTPNGVSTDSAGNVYVADTRNHTIRKINPAGAVSTLAGTAGSPGSADGLGAEARFSSPRSVATDSAGNLYVADTGNSTVRRTTPAGSVTTIVGVAGVVGFTPGALPGVLASPQGIAISGNRLYITLYNGLATVINLP